MDIIIIISQPYRSISVRRHSCSSLHCIDQRISEYHTQIILIDPKVIWQASFYLQIDTIFFCHLSLPVENCIHSVISAAVSLPGCRYMLFQAFNILFCLSVLLLADQILKAEKMVFDIMSVFFHLFVCLPDTFVVLDLCGEQTAVHFLCLPVSYIIQHYIPEQKAHAGDQCTDYTHHDHHSVFVKTVIRHFKKFLRCTFQQTAAGYDKQLK